MASPDRFPDAPGVPNDGAKEPRDARRRRELIEATITSIAQHGLSGTTVARVAELAGLSAGIVSFYFQTKDALLLATLEHVDREFDRRQQQATGRDPHTCLGVRLTRFAVNKGAEGLDHVLTSGCADATYGLLRFLFL